MVIGGIVWCMASDKSEVLRIRIEYVMLGKLKTRAKKEFRTMASIVREAIHKYLNGDK